jgi:hypothetical protein
MIYVRLNSNTFHRARFLRYEILYTYRWHGHTIAALVRDG